MLERDRLFFMSCPSRQHVGRLDIIKEIDLELDEPAETSLADRYSDMESDLKLVSSDDLVFRIPSYALQASS